MKTMKKPIKKAQLGGLIKKGIKAATKITPKKSLISKRAAKLGEDYGNLLSDESLDWANSPAMKHYLDNKKPAPNLRKAQQKVNERKAAQLKEIDDSYNTSGPAIKVKRKTGGSVKKAKNGTSLGMKSVKAGFDKNPGVTRADIIVAGKGQARSGAKLKKQAATAIAMKKAGKTPKAMMKSGGSMKKCRGGCK